MNRTQKLYELAHGLLYPDSGADCYPEEFRVRHAETLRLADELFALRGATPDEEGRLCLALLMGYMATIYDSGDKAQRRAAVLDRIPDNRLTAFASWLLTMSFVAALWVFFRADSWSDAATILAVVGHDFSLAYAPAFAAARTEWLIMMLAIVGAHMLPANFWERVRYAFVASPWIIKLFAFIITVQLVVEFRSADVQPFIYFQF